MTWIAVIVVPIACVILGVVMTQRAADRGRRQGKEEATDQWRLEREADEWSNRRNHYTNLLGPAEGFTRLIAATQGIGQRNPADAKVAVTFGDRAAEVLSLGTPAACQATQRLLDIWTARWASVIQAGNAPPEAGEWRESLAELKKAMAEDIRPTA